MLHEGHKPVISIGRELDALQIAELHESQKPIVDRALYDTKTSLETEGTPPKGCWQNQSGYQYHSTTFSPVLDVLMQVTIRLSTRSGAGHQRFFNMVCSTRATSQ